MTKYKGYYIDHVVFNSEADIDNHIKEYLIARIKQVVNRMFSTSDSGYAIACSEQISRYEKRLHNEFGYTWEEIEALEIV